MNRSIMKEDRAKPLIIICGIGTGGHYFPAFVVAKAFLKKRHEVLVLVRAGYHEEKIAQLDHLEIFSISAQPFFGRTVVTKIRFLFAVLHAVYRLNPLTKKCIGFSFGGFGSLPLIVSCLINRRPFYIFEPNSIPGRATRMFARRARKVFLGIPLEVGMNGNCLMTGVPIRPEFKSYAPADNPGPQDKHILFMGGSQGAKKVNELALELAATFSSEYRITIISGYRDYEWVLQRRDARTAVIPFTNDPWREIGSADIVISRSGALAGYEILAMNKKAIFVPFPHAIDNHQYHNGLFFTKIGAGRLIEEKDLTVGRLKESIIELLKLKPGRTGHLLLDAEDRIVTTVEQEVR